MDPVVRLGLTQPKVQAVHGLQGVGLLIDEDKKQFVFHLGQAAFGAAAQLPLAYFAVPGLVQRITSGRSRDKRRQHTQKLLVGQSSRGEKISWSVLQSSVSRSEERRVGKECRSRWSPY